MVIKINKKLGNHTIQFEIDERDEIEALHKMAFLTAPDYCGLCKGKNIIWNGRKVNAKDGSGKVYTFISRKCLECGAESQLGEHQTGGYFWKKWKKFEKRNSAQEEVIDVGEGKEVFEAL